MYFHPMGNGASENPEPTGHGAIEVPSLHQYLCHLNALSPQLLVPFKQHHSIVICAIKYSHSTLTCGV
jgi:hypothetical protein